MESNIFESKPPSRLSGARRLRMGATGWGALPYFRVEFVKLHNYCGKPRSTALLKVVDALGEVSVFFEGHCVGALFDLDPKQWKELENVVGASGELFYKPFKGGLKDTFLPEQQLFYSFCMRRLYRDLLFVSFKRAPNMRKGKHTQAFLQVLDCVKPNPRLMDLYSKIVSNK